MKERLAWLVEQLRLARDRRAAGDWTDRLDRVLDALASDYDHPQTAPKDDAEFVARIQNLARVFGLDSDDVNLLVVAAAVDLDANFGLAYALLQGDPARLRPSAGVAMELCGLATLSGDERRLLGPGGPLVRHDLIDVVGDEPLLHRALRVPDRVVCHLTGDDAPDQALRAMAVEPIVSDLVDCTALSAAIGRGASLAWIRSTPGGAGLSAAAAAFDAQRIDYIAIDLRRCPPSVPMEVAIRNATRDAGLRRCGLIIAGADKMIEPEQVGLLQLLEWAAVPVVAVARRSWDATWLPRLPFITDAPETTTAIRDQLWRGRISDADVVGGPGWRELISLRLSPEEIDQIARHAAELAAVRAEPLSAATAREAARRLSSDISGTRGSRSTASFDDLMLPPQILASLHELVSWARHRDDVLGQGPLAGKGDKGRGITALFAGSPGTGKTLAAHVIASELGLELFTVELSSIVDKYIGETEKNLERVFREAESLNVLLFFDEADALFGARSEVKDARDRYANQEVAYLLQRMEQFDGIAVLATNLSGNLDVAFSRRLNFVVNFPDPDAPTRRELWATHVSALADTDSVDAIDLDHLAETVHVSGGDVRNIVLAAAYAAASDGVPVGMRHIVDAVIREYRKLGRRLPIPGLVRPGDAVPQTQEAS